MITQTNETLAPYLGDPDDHIPFYGRAEIDTEKPGEVADTGEDDDPDDFESFELPPFDPNQKPLTLEAPAPMTAEDELGLKLNGRRVTGMIESALEEAGSMGWANPWIHHADMKVRDYLASINYITDEKRAELNRMIDEWYERTAKNGRTVLDVARLRSGDRI